MPLIPLAIRPTVEKGVLTFKNQEQLNQYYDFLEQKLDSSDDPDSTLAIYENNLGYTSYRSTLPLSFFDFNEYDKLDVFVDPIVSSMSNSDYTYGIGDKLSIAREKEDYLVDKANVGLIRKLKSIPYSESLDLQDITSDVEITRSTNSLQVFSTSSYLDSRDRCDVTISVSRQTPICDFPLDFFVKIEVENVTIGTIHWGDGAASDFNLSTGKWSFDHTYAHPGKYNIHVEAVPLGCKRRTADFMVNASTIDACVDRFHEANAEMNDNNSSVGKTWYFKIKVYSKGTTSNGGALWQNYVKAHSRSYHRRKVGKRWHPQKAYHRLQVYSIFRNVECNSMAHEEQYKDWDKTKYAHVRVHAGPGHRFHKTGDSWAWFEGKTCNNCPNYHTKLVIPYSCF